MTASSRARYAITPAEMASELPALIASRGGPARIAAYGAAGTTARQIERWAKGPNIMALYYWVQRIPLPADLRQLEMSL